ncbi:type I-C CRISPR-associated protein Cas8c/Csd1 [Saccharopolyspora sp. 6V]|uniref:type I-C CRISPR-associated protein Cas8c/Csd1 n=1 Tax=Saccharopolyspora sp. 6V TaxID=2877239 RepID=UPI001CD6A1C6|nr:type I-C CRISPR-associated protein Cas8c/Csd1 [Saccharopolyspora sp. 6V]MCA1194606.1 type I-C CRISPR-associated protein Cas8c/Csd1 [Saccharopolyspora sp. 6V]
MLHHIVEYAREHCDLDRPFHRVRECQWELDIRTDRGEITEARLTPLADETDEGKGPGYPVPTLYRSSKVDPLLAADTVQYVLGWADEKANVARTAQYHSAFADLIQRWSGSSHATDDPIAQALGRFYREHRVATVERPDEFTSNQRVLLAVDGQAAHEADSVPPFWFDEVLRRKGTGTSGTCLVCGQISPLLSRIPLPISGKLVPGASNEAVLVSINERVFGYDLSEALHHVPVCATCGDALSAGLEDLLERDSITLRGQDSRTAWWLVNPKIPTHIDALDKPDQEQIRHLLYSVWKPDETDGAGRLDEESLGMFYALSVGGNRSRIMIRDWIEMPLIQLESNIRDWFLDHETEPAWPDGHRMHGIKDLARCLGRWEARRGRYVDFTDRSSDRPRYIIRELHRCALRKKPLPPALRAHLVHRISSDGHVDDRRAALIRLALNRSASTKENRSMPPGLDPDHRDPAYLAGRLFAVLAQLQAAANNNREANQDDPDAEQQQELNTTYTDRFFAGAARNPCTALVTGRLDAKAWFSKLRRTGRGGLSTHFEKQLHAIYGLIDATDGLPATNNLQQQEQFILGYHHERAARPTKTEPGAEEEPTDQPTDD